MWLFCRVTQKKTENFYFFILFEFDNQEAENTTKDSFFDEKVSYSRCTPLGDRHGPEERELAV